MSQLFAKLDDPLPSPWNRLSYQQLINRPDGLLVHGGRASRVHFFEDNGNHCYLKRYLYRKIHWRDCWRPSPGRREYENLEKIRGLDLGCQPIRILAWGEERRWRILKSAFLLSREVPGSQRLSLFLQDKNQAQRKQVIAAVVQAITKIIGSGLALGDLFFRNFVVIPDNANLFLLDLQFCDPDLRRAREKSYPQIWSNIHLMFSEAERIETEEILAPILPYPIEELKQRSAALITRERKHLSQEQAYAVKIAKQTQGETK